MAGKVLIMGNHPLVDNLVRQYEEMHYVVDCRQEVTTQTININDYDELCLLTSVKDVGKEWADYSILSLIPLLTEDYDVKLHQGKKLLCHMLMQSQQTLRMLQTTDFCETFRQKVDLYPFSMNDEWCRSIIFDYKPITIQSDMCVHVAIFGMDEISEKVAIQAAHVSHFPNYLRNHTLRTRITMIDVNAERKSLDLRKRYRHLFDNSFYRVVKPSEEKAISEFHKPMFKDGREDFVDVEWEFVKAESWDSVLREKLCIWANDNNQLLTVVMAYNDVNKNISESLLLPQDIYDRSIPIHIYGRQNEGYDVKLPLVTMAKNVNYIYDRCFHDNFEEWHGQILSSVEIDIKKRDSLWTDLSNVKRLSNIYNAMTIPSKLRSIGLNKDDWDKFYDISQRDIEILAQVEHNRWNVEELISGYRPCTDEEQDKIAADVETQKDSFRARKIHYDLRAYNDLRPDKTGRTAQVYDLCLSSALPLIAKTFVDEKGGAV